jgi:hypothetical protein
VLIVGVGLAAGPWRGVGSVRHRAGEAGPGGVLLVQVAQDLLDAVLVFNRPVKAEVEFGDAAQTQLAAEVSAEKRRGALERAGRVGAGLLVAERGVSGDRP